MKMKLVRKYLLEKRVGISETRTSDTGLIIDGAYLKGTYQLSGCQYILGGEYDRYANYLKNTLGRFVKLGIECFVIFNGGMKADNETRKAIHNNIINKTDALRPGRIENEYCEPIFVKDVQREVFQELNITYFVCEYDHREALFTLARQCGYPVLTNNFEYCLFGVSCIVPRSVVFDIGNGFRCTVYHPCTRLFPLRDDLMSTLLAISDEDAIYYKHMPSILKCHMSNVFKNAQYWIRRQTKSSAIDYLTKYLTLEEKDSLLTAIAYIRHLLISDEHFVLNCFNNFEGFVEQSVDVKKKNWFRDGVSTGKIAIPYINLKYRNTFSGSWLISDGNKDDAMLVAMDLVFYALGIMSNCPNLSISFIGRQFDQSHVWLRDFKLKSDDALQLLHNESNCSGSEDVFKVAIREILCGFDFDLLNNLPEDCHMLIIALVYYCAKTKESFMNGVYSILLSYLMLGPISNCVGLLKRSNFSVTHSTNEVQEDRNKKRTQYIAVAQAFIDFFYVEESSLTHQFYRDVLHSIAEFEHCFQHVNYLNRLCGERTKCTSFHKTMNTTFVYNVFIALKSEESPLDYIKARMNSRSIYLEYTNIVDVFEKCLKTVKVEVSTEQAN